MGYVKLPADPNTTRKGIAIAATLMVVALLSMLGVSTILLGQEAGVVFIKTYILSPAISFRMAIGPYWLGRLMD